MSIASVMQRIAEIDSAFAPPTAATPTAATATTSSTLTQAAPVSFDAQLTGALGGTATTAAAPAAGGTSAGQAIVNIARGEVGVREQPPGSNDGPRIAQYRQATAGSGVGPWCAYFASWAARQAGVPLGDSGQGFGAVASVWSWAQQTGKALPAGSKPAPGDLIVWGSRHIGIVESVDPSGAIHTIEGNSSDQVSRRTYGADGGGATGYVRLG
jgi:cell wall-associated NlpC family hydrolase